MVTSVVVSSVIVAFNFNLTVLTPVISLIPSAENSGMVRTPPDGVYHPAMVLFSRLVPFWIVYRVGDAGVFFSFLVIHTTPFL